MPVQRKQVILGFDFTLLLQLLPKLLLFSAWSPDWCRLIVRILVDSSHPLEAAQLLVSVNRIVILIFLVLLFFFLGLGILSRRVCFATPAPFGRLFALKSLFVALSSPCVMLAQFLGGTMTANICNGLRFLLLSQFFSLLLFLLLLFELESFSSGLKLSFIDDEKVAGTTLRKVWLC